MANLAQLDDEYHGLHAAAVQPGYRRVAWQERHERTTRVRVCDYTCECQQIVYELCQAGGLMFVRRFYRCDGVLEHQSDWLRAPAATRLWSRILLGQAR
ncbi:hypothetical protein AB0L53_15475 [Nonomuraea sp. NPDC052129]|uniref:hypothetical protein n=1 Tax=Nonomuraea sp. NPDC052129 TaxID=3154651 RepID=UPI00342198EA